MRWIILIAILLCAAAASFGTTWHVPGDCPTIQAALDSLSDGDTILVAPGVYSESLQAPNDLYFVMIGQPDTVKQNDEWPIIDPSLLDGSNRLACLTLPFQTSALIAGIIFRNQWQMYPRGGGTPTGGIFNNGLGLTLRTCRFDSTYRSLYPNIGPLTVTNCEFIQNVTCCIKDLSGSNKTITNCSFSGTNQLLWLEGPALVENCSFGQTVAGDWIWLSGEGITIRGCTFGPTTVPSYSIIWSGGASGCVIEQNVFHDLEVSGATIHFAGTAGEPNEFCDNLFQRIQGVNANESGAGISLHLMDWPATYLICANQFEECRGFASDGFRAVNWSTAHVLMTDNLIIGGDMAIPSVDVYSMTNANSRIVWQDFSGTGYALRNSGALLLADSCWWGDSTGPYHQQLNPQGLGAMITGPVSFEPWLRHDPDPDSTEAAPDPHSVLPSTTSLEVYPNPFNATANLRLVVDQPGAYNVDLYNTLGQHVKELWSGDVMSEKHITINTDALASSIYFACVRQSANHHPLALTKILLLK